MRVEPSRRRDYRGQGRPTDRRARVEEPACKPDSVPRARRRTGGPGGGHLSGSRVAATLVQPTREHRAGHPLPARPCSGWGLPSRPVTRPLVSSYLTVSPLPLFETVGTEHDLDRWARSEEHTSELQSRE